MTVNKYINDRKDRCSRCDRISIISLTGVVNGKITSETLCQSCLSKDITIKELSEAFSYGQHH